MARSLAWLREAGFSAATLWVLDTNRIGIGFYEVGGWEPDGTVRIDESFGAPLREIRHRIEL
jgi:hypothetical protein